MGGMMQSSNSSLHQSLGSRSGFASLGQAGVGISEAREKFLVFVHRLIALAGCWAKESAGELWPTITASAGQWVEIVKRRHPEQKSSKIVLWGRPIFLNAVTELADSRLVEFLNWM
jgi:hypothetical protein